jgi:hypothetical protein
MTWPTAIVDGAARARILAEAIPGAALAEAELDAPYDEVWAWLSDLEGSVPQFDTHVGRLKVTRRDGNKLTVVARGPVFPLRLTFDAVMEDGSCFMQARRRLYLVCMTVTPLDGGRRSLVTHMEGVPLPFTRWLRPYLRWVVRRDVRGIARHFALR